VKSKKIGDIVMEYKVILESFEGPLDLLYHLIEKNKVDIYDIPISQIAAQYIQYLQSMKSVDLEVTSEFLVMAATLLEIKSKMLLPTKEDLDGEQLEIDEVDPREELIRRLIEYKKFKDLAEELKLKEEIQKKIFYKPREEMEELTYDDEPVLEGLSLENLIEIFSKVMIKNNIREKEINIREIERDEITIEESMKKVIETIYRDKEVKFQSLLEGNITKSRIVATFLAILELIKLKSIIISQGNNFDEIIVRLNRNK